MESMVYLIDDEPVVRTSIDALISSLGIASKSYSNAVDFLDDFVDGTPPRQCVIVDLRMPDIGGIELKQELVKRGSNVPVILLTGYCPSETEDRARALNIFEILEKPCHPDSLGALIRRAFASISTEK